MQGRVFGAPLFWSEEDEMQNSRVSAVGVKSFVFHGFGSWEFFLTAKQKCIARLSFLCLLTEK